MPYAVEADVERAAGGEEKLIQLTDYELLGQVNSTRVTEAIDEAESVINSYLETRYEVPLTDAEVTEIIRRVTAREAVYILKEQREALTPADQTRHEERIAWLDEVRRGNVSPGIDPRPKKSSNVTPQVGDREDLNFSLTREKFEGWT